MEKVKERNKFVELLKSFWVAEMDEEEENEQILKDASEQEKEEYKRAWKNIEKIMDESEKKHLGNKKRSDLKLNTKPHKMPKKEELEINDDEELER